jgi:ABC-type bacteriocin/lantibiotic exporter with double-glycine peptidase domain
MTIVLKSFTQKTSTDCGPACVKMVLNYYKIKYNYREILKGTKCTEDEGISGRTLAKFLRSKGIKSEYREYVTYDQVKEMVDNGHPVIVAWFSPTPGNHWSVMTYAGKNKITLQDPTTGKKRHMTVEEFDRVWFSVGIADTREELKKNPCLYLSCREVVTAIKECLKEDDGDCSR